jgi:hypothetical protein
MRARGRVRSPRVARSDVKPVAAPARAGLAVPNSGRAPLAAPLLGLQAPGVRCARHARPAQAAHAPPDLTRQPRGISCLSTPPLCVDLYVDRARLYAAKGGCDRLLTLSLAHTSSCLSAAARREGLERRPPLLCARSALAAPLVISIVHVAVVVSAMLMCAPLFFRHASACRACVCMPGQEAPVTRLCNQAQSPPSKPLLRGCWAPGAEEPSASFAKLKPSAPACRDAQHPPTQVHEPGELASTSLSPCLQLHITRVDK